MTCRLSTAGRSLDEFYSDARECTACHQQKLIDRDPECGHWAYPVFHRDPNPRSEILFVGEAPNWSATFDANKGFLTIGDYGDPAGEFMSKLLAAVDLKYEDVIFSNIVQCLPREVKGNHPPSVTQVKLCSPWLRRLIDIVDPRVVVTFGGVALQGLKRIERHGYALQQDAGHIRTWSDRLVLPLYHPSRLGRAHRSEEEQLRDINVLKLRPWVADPSPVGAEKEES